MAVFHEQIHAEKFIIRINAAQPGRYQFYPSKLYDFDLEPSEIVKAMGL